MSTSGGTNASGANPDDYSQDTVMVFNHEGDGENTEHLKSMDLHDVKTALEKDAEQDETPGSAGKASSPGQTSAATTSSGLPQATLRPIIQPMLYANSFMVPPFATAGTPIYAGLRPIKMEGSDWKVSQGAQVAGIPYGYPAAGFLPVDQSGGIRPAGYPFMIPGQYVAAQMPYQQFTTFGQPVAPNATVQPNSGLVQPQVKEKKPHIKKPLNAFMIFMKTKRAEVIKECTLKESAAINQILGKMWHALDRSEQAKYYEMAREERARHMQMYPGWSARDNYAIHKKRRKRKAKNEKNDDDAEGSSDNCALLDSEGLKCAEKFGEEQTDNWCGVCRRKKRCVKRTEEDDELLNNDVTDVTKNSNMATILGTIGKESIQESAYVTAVPGNHDDILTSSQSIQSDSNIIQAPITLQTIPT